jgi:heterotetrameric sarcosine oxidase gamma subunit
MLEHQRPFDCLLEDHAETFIDELDLRITTPEAGFLLLQSTSESSLRDMLASELSLALPAPQEARARSDHTLLWLAPSEWLLEHPASQTDSLQHALTHLLAASLTVVTDVSDALACCEISGARAAEVLMAACSLDLRAHAFPTGRVARTALADIPATIWNPGRKPQRLRCIVDRSFAKHLRDSLLDVA